MKAVMISIQPKWCELISSGKKTVEVRKTKPKLETPFKCYIYCTSVKPMNLSDYVEVHSKTNGVIDDWSGKVIGEFVCDDIRWGNPVKFVVKEDAERTLKGSCLTIEDMYKYLNVKDGTSRYEKKYEFYCWNISELRIYDNPKDLNEFYRHDASYDNAFGWAFDDREKNTPLTKAPQSWCYVEELG